MKLSSGVALAMGLLCLTSQGWAADTFVRAIRYNASSHTVQIDASAPVRAAVNSVSVAGRQRVILDLDNAELGPSLPQDSQLFRDLSGHISSLRNLSTHQYGSSTHPMVRVVLDLDASVQRPRLIQNEGSQIELVLGSSSPLRQASSTNTNYCAIHRCSPAALPNWTGMPSSVSSNPISTTANGNSPIRSALPTSSDSDRTTGTSSSSVTLQELKQTLLRANQRYEQVVAQNANLSQQLQSVKAEQAALAQTAKAEPLKEDPNKIAAQELLKAENNRLNQKTQTLENEMDRLREQNTGQEQLKAENKRLSQQAQALEKEVTKRHDKNPEQQQLITENKRLSQKAQALENEIANLREQSAGQQKQITLLNSRQPEEKDKNTATALEKAHQEQIEQFSRQQKQNEQQIQALQAEKNKLQAQLATMPTKGHTPAAASTPSSPEISSMRKQLIVAQASLNEAIRTINEQNKEVANLRSQINDVKNTGDASTGGAADEALQKQLQEKNATIAQLQKQMQSLKSSDPKPPAASTVIPNSEAEGINLDIKSGTGLANAERHYQSAKTALQAKRMDQALSDFHDATALAPDNGRYAIDASAALAENQKIPEGIEVLTRYLNRNPSDREAYTQLGKLYLLNDQAEAATQAFNRAIPVSTLNNYASALKKTNRLQEAESIFKLALILNPKDSEVLFNFGNLYNAMDKASLARDYYQKALVVRPDFAEAHYNLGLIYARLGDRPQAISHLEQFLKLSPEAKNAETIKAYIQKLKA
jgi:tetratricopeptide (TPR) repeat protein